MHPIERLRYVARSSHVPAAALARETAMALTDFVGDDAAMLIACRRILDRQPSSAPLVWLAAHALGAPDQHQALWDAVSALENDATIAALDYNLPDDATIACVGWNDIVSQLARRRGDLGFVVIDTDGNADYQIDRLRGDRTNMDTVDAEGTAQAMFDATHLIISLEALGPDNGLAPLGTFAAAAVASHIDLPAWGVASVGVALPERMYAGLQRRWNEHAGEPRYLRELEELPSGLLDQVISAAGGGSIERAIGAGGCPIVPELF